MSEKIIYPEKGANGANILRESPVIIEPRPMIYSLRADLGRGNKVKVIIPVPDDSENTWSFFRYAGMSVGWRHAPVFSSAGQEMHFLADLDGHADLPAYFVGHNSIELKIFENDKTKPVRLKLLKW
jgi:hypothetical protein